MRCQCVVFSAFLVSAFIVPLHAADLISQDVLSSIEKAQEGLQDLRGEFLEIVKLPQQEPQKRRGRFFFKKPHSLKVDELAPQRQSLLSDGSTFQLFTPKAQQVLTGDWLAWVSRTEFPEPFFSFLGTLPVSAWEENYQVLFRGKEEGTYSFLLKPKQAAQATLELWVSEATFLPIRGRMTSKLRSTEMRFDGLQMNTMIPDAEFRLKLPKGTSVTPVTL